MASTGVTQKCDNDISITNWLNKPETVQTTTVHTAEQANLAAPTATDGEVTEQSQTVQDMADVKTNEQPEPAETTVDVENPEPPKLKKKKNRGKKRQPPKVKKSATLKTNDNRQAAGNTVAPAGPALSKTVKNKLKAQEKAAKTARAAQIAAAAKAKKMGVSASAGETAEASGDASSSSADPVTTSSSSEDGDTAEDSESSGVDAPPSIEIAEEISTDDTPRDSEDDSPTDTSSSSRSDAGDGADTPESSDVEDIASTSHDVSPPFDASKNVMFPFGGNSTHNFDVGSSFKTGDAALSGIIAPVNVTDLLAGFGRVFSPSAAIVAAPLAPKVRKATSFAKAIHTHHEKHVKPFVVDGSKTPRDAVPVKLNRKPLPESAKKDHQVTNPLFQTLVKKASSSAICAKAAFNLHTKFDVTLPRKPVKKTSKPLKIDYYGPMKGESSGKVLELEDGDDEEMRDAPSVAEAEDLADEADAPRITEIDDELEDAEVAEPTMNTEQVVEVVFEDTESTHSEVEQQGEAADQGSTEILEQIPDDDITGDIIDEQASSASISETPDGHDAPSAAILKSELSFLSFKNAAEYHPVLSREAERALIDMHITPLHAQKIPGAVEKPLAAGNQAAAKASKKAAKIEKKASPSPGVVAEVLQLAEEVIVDSPQVDTASLPPVEKSELNFLSFPIAAEFLPVLSREAEQAIIDAYVTPLHLQQVPGAVVKPTASEKKASKKAAKAEKKAAAKQVAMSIPDVSEEVASELIDAPEESSADTIAAAPELAELPSVEQEISDVAREDESTPKVHEDISAPIVPAEQETAGANETPQPNEAAPPAKPFSSYTQERIAIEMAHTLLGIVSLGKFLVALPKSPSFTITKDALCSTFGSFAAAECRILLDRVPPYMNGKFDDRVVQCKTLLGHTSLYDFLQAVQWTGDSTSLKEIERVFKEKSAEASDFDTQLQAIADGMAMG